MNEDNDKITVSEILRGNTNSYKVIIERYQVAVYNFAYRMLQDSEDAKDITQNVFIKAYQKLSSYDDSYKFFSWLYRIAVNETINFKKSKRQFEEIDESSQESVITADDRELELEEKAEYLNIAIAHLKNDYKILIVMKYFHGLSYQEIGQVLEQPEKKVKSRLYTARQLLKNFLINKGYYND